ncbi:protein Frey 1 isoform 1-T1 [Dama dama]|uniref:protein Frey 1 isoform X1 n=1 Tax=Dama dama TaxID=30532 RepID=UPI002A36A289|nr:protein Frey 1 isoform X1 [Dama dama]
MWRPGAGGLCEAAPGVGSRFRRPAHRGEGQAEAGIWDPAEDGSHHAGGFAPQGRAEPLRPVPRPGSRASPPPATEVTPGGPGPAAWKWGVLCGPAPPWCQGPPHPQILLPVLGGGGCSLASAEHPNFSHRPQRSVPEEFSAPLELSEPLSGLVDDYGVRPKHPWPRGPRPLLSRAQQRKRDGPDMAEYYYDSRL